MSKGGLPLPTFKETFRNEFLDVTQKEPDRAVEKLVSDLNISGSILGVYNIYEAIQTEWERARMIRRQGGI
jgi:hypothetical protein